MAQRKRDEDHNKHPGVKHVWVLLGTDRAHDQDRDIWMCQREERCGRETDPARRQFFMDKAMCEMAQMITGKPVEVQAFALEGH